MYKRVTSYIAVFARTLELSLFSQSLVQLTLGHISFKPLYVISSNFPIPCQVEIIPFHSIPPNSTILHQFDLVSLVTLPCMGVLNWLVTGITNQWATFSLTRSSRPRCFTNLCMHPWSCQVVELVQNSGIQTRISILIYSQLVQGTFNYTV